MAIMSETDGKRIERQQLPSSAAAWDLIRRCFDIRHKDLNGVTAKDLERFAKQENISAKRSQLIESAIRGFLWEERLPISGANGSPINILIRATISRLISAYLPIQERFCVKPEDIDDALFLVIEEVLVPSMAEAVADQLMNFQDALWQTPWMIGNEFQGDSFWYLPRNQDGKSESPLQHTLECWLRAGGLNTGYGFGKHIDGEDPGSPKKGMERWRNGRKPDSLCDLHRYTEQVGRVDWLGGSAAWKARFTLAWAVQTAGEELDRIFSNRIPNPSIHFAEVYRKSARYAVRYECYGPVSFVARLVENELRRSGALHEWTFVQKLRKHLSDKWKAPPALDAVLEGLAVRQYFLLEARDKGVLGEGCISPLFGETLEGAGKVEQNFCDLTLPINDAMPPKVFHDFCEFATGMGVDLLNDRLRSKGRGK